MLAWSDAWNHLFEDAVMTKMTKHALLDKETGDVIVSCQKLINP